jgi:hypothetical protein
MTSGSLLQIILLTATKCSLHPVIDRCASIGKTISRIEIVNSQDALRAGLTMISTGRYNTKHIRPLAVSPLNYLESEPNPRGFLFSGSLIAGAPV